MTAAIKLGSTCIDKATGYKGIATAKVEFLNGNVQYSIVPKAKAGADYPNGISLDGAQLDVADPGISDVSVTPKQTDIMIGEKVKDIISGLSGIVVNKTTFINGCIYFTVAVKDAKKDPADLFLPVERCERVSSGIVAKLKAAGKPTGGPATKAMRMS